MNSCPCHSKKPYEECCKAFHEGTLPKTPLELMRSRYSAYAMGLCDYIIETTYPHGGLIRDDIEAFYKNTEFVGLKILDSDENFVTFRAELKQGGQEASFTEKSRFLKVNDRLYYVDGVVS